MKKLSPAMKRAIALARENYGYLRWHWCNQWGEAIKAPAGRHEHWFTTETIQALIDRGLAEYTGWIRYTRGERITDFPCEITLTSKGFQA